VRKNEERQQREVPENRLRPSGSRSLPSRKQPFRPSILATLSITMNTMHTTDVEKLLLDFVNKKGYRSVKPAVIARKLKLGDADKRELKRAVKKLVKKGLLKYGSNHLVEPAPADQRKHLITGVFRRTDKGYGFVRPADAPPEVGREQDIYVAEAKSQDAASGDVVLVRVSTQPPKPGSDPAEPARRRGTIVEVIERQTHQFVGVYDEAAGTGFVQIDGGIFNRPIWVGDPGAKNATPGDKVVIEMVRFPRPTLDGEGVITEVLGPRGKPGVDTLSVIREFGLPDDFSEAVLDDAHQQAEAFDEAIGENRRDLTGETIVTIDPHDARDFDDAISVKRLENGHWILGVHIADVAHFVPLNSALDIEARDRATSVYLPDRVIPMLPEVISNNLASLQPGRVRYTKTAHIEFTPEGARVGTETCSAAIKSKWRFNYEEVDDFLAHPNAWKKRLPADVFQLLGDMHELAMMLRTRRMDRGALEMGLPEVDLELDGEGKVAGAHLVENTESHQIIEEFMLAANMAVAEMFRDRELDFLRRIHESPDPRKLKLLTEFVRALGIHCESLESRFEIKRVLEEIKDKPEKRAINYAVLRSMQKAVYSPQDVGHYALASDCYCHFTSPIRRYPDLTIHRTLDAIHEGKKPATDFDRLMVVGEHCSDRERRAELAERALTKVKLLEYFRQRIGEKMRAVVTGVERFGLFAQGIEMPAEGLIHIRSLHDDYYHFDRTTHSLEGRKANNRFQLGDVILVEVAHVDIDERQLDLRFLARTSSKKAAPKRGATKKGGRRKKSSRKTTRKTTSRKKAATQKVATKKKAAPKKKTTARKKKAVRKKR
jgi:ribonuclease R